MRKVLIGALAGLALIGGQALAAGASQPLKVGDRVGATSGPSSEFFEEIPIWVVIGGVAILTYAVIQTSDEDESRSS